MLKKNKDDYFFLIIFILLPIITTFPLFFKIFSFIPGFSSTDEVFGILWDYWRIKYSLMRHISLDPTSLIAHPFGASIYGQGFFSYIWMGLVYTFNIIASPIFTYNLQVFINLFTGGVCAYLLSLQITKSRLVSLFAGIIFAYSPYEFSRIWQHLGLSYIQWIPLVLLALIRLKERPFLKNKFLFFSSLLLALSFDFSIMYFSGISMILFLVYTAWYNLKLKKFDKEYFKIVAFLTFLVFFALLPQFLPTIINAIKLSASTIASAHNPFHRPFEDLFAQSARPLSYFLPAAAHPIFGKFTEQFVGTNLYGMSFTEHTLYLGWVPLFLAFIAFRRWRRSCRKLSANDDFYIGFFVFLAIAAWLFSQPPWWNIFGFKLYMPSFFMYKVLPMFRAYCRFGIIVMLAVAVLACFGLKFFLERFKSQKIKIVYASLFCCLVLFEFWNYPPFKVINLSRVPAVYYWLKSQPGDFPIAEYPLDINGPNEKFKFYQTVHHKNIINGTVPGSQANTVSRGMVKLSEAATAQKLKRMGVKYILVHSENYLNTGLTEEQIELAGITKNPSIELVKSFSAEECPNNTACIQKTGQVDVYMVN